MPRRDDGTTIRYEFQVFDTPKGQVIAAHLERLKEEGGSVAAFVRDALFFYIQYQSQGANMVSFSGPAGDFDTPQPTPTSGFSTLPIDDGDDEMELEVREVNDTTSAQNFLNSVLGLVS